MSKPSKSFEKQVKRIISTLEKTGANIKWNDHVRDPDNPKQKRQVDITIKNDDVLTIVECRQHGKAQSVTWVEELIGRKISLRADCVIAVSSSGFTKGAIKKADKYGIILRDLISVSSEEVSQWGKTTKIHINLYKFTDLRFDFFFIPHRKMKVFVKDIYKEALDKKSFLYILQEIANSLENDRLKTPMKLTASLDGNNDSYHCGNLLKIEVSGMAVKMKEEVVCPSCFLYGISGANISDHDALLQKFDLGKTEIVKSKEAGSIILDFSAIDFPKNTFFGSIELDMGAAVPLTIEKIIGMESLGRRFSGVKFGVHFPGKDIIEVIEGNQ